MVLQVRVAPTPGKKIEHNGIRVQLIGQIEMSSEKGNFYDFLSLGQRKSKAQASIRTFCCVCRIMDSLSH